jgi:hypothetical protein
MHEFTPRKSELSSYSVSSPLAIFFRIVLFLFEPPPLNEEPYLLKRLLFLVTLLSLEILRLLV